MKKMWIDLIKIYQKKISPIFHFWGVNCKFYPSCSQYMLEAIQKYGSCKGIYIGIKRLLRCNPFAKGGYDPLK